MVREEREVCGDMKPRWMIERKATNRDAELLQVVVLYAENENKELVKAENKNWSYDKHLIMSSN